MQSGVPSCLIWEVNFVMGVFGWSGESETLEYAERKEEDLEAREEFLVGSEGTLEMGEKGLVVQPLCCGHNKLWLDRVA